MKSQETPERYEVIVIGAGPAGIMAAGTAAGWGRKTALLERNDQIGRKLRLAGGGRCNVATLAALDEFFQAFGRQGQFLRSALAEFGLDQLRKFLTDIGVSVYQENNQLFITGGGRVLVDKLAIYLRRQGVKLFYQQRVKKIASLGDGSFEIKTDDRRFLARRKVILAVGGKSYPHTGSSGDGFTLAGDVGHEIITPVPALGPVHLTKNPFQTLAGVSLPEVMVEVFVGGKREGKFTGGFLITHQGISGPAVLDASLTIARAMQKEKAVSLKINFLPGWAGGDFSVLEKVPHRLRDVLLKLAGIESGQSGYEISSSRRHRLVQVITGLQVDVANTGSWDQAMVTAGGVSLKQVDPRTMESRLVRGLYFAGEILDLAGRCGGFNIQAALATGYLAGSS